MTLRFGHRPKAWGAVLFGILMSASSAHALQLDWAGQFRFDQNWMNNYQLDHGRPGYDADQGLVDQGGPYVPGVGEKNVVWYSAFFRLKPKLVVNDSVNIRSEWHLGSPIYGFFGRSFPANGDERFNFTGSQRDGMLVSAQRYWANIITDFGTIEVGRAPIHWGLGAVWNSGDGLYDRYMSTGDMIRLTSKFGNFSIQPALVKVAMGNNVAGASTAGGSVTEGNDDVTDFDLAVKYDNSEEDFEFGMMWTKRSGNAAQKALYFSSALTGSTRLDFNIFDFYARKKIGRFRLGGELPLYNGNIGAVDGVNEFEYKTFALIFEGGYSSDMWDIGLKLGHVPGQPPSSPGDRKFYPVFLHKNYDLGLIMFQYNLYGLSRNNPDTVAAASLNSPYDAQISNATYLAVNPELKLDRWTIRSTFALAFADERARSGFRFYNSQRRQFYNAIDNQSSFMGWEMDYGVLFKWDENVQFGWDFGLWFPGGYYEFANSPYVKRLETDMMFASQARIGITF